MRPAISIPLLMIVTLLQACGADTPTGVRPLPDFSKRGGEGHKHHAKPIKGRCDITFEIQPLERGPGGQVTKAKTPFTGECHISGGFGGHSTVTGDPTVTLNPDASGAASGPLVFKGHHGAELRGMAAATFPNINAVGDGDHDADDRIPLTGTLDFIGGEGRFADADGSAALGLSIDLDGRKGKLVFKGFTGVSGGDEDDEDDGDDDD